MRAVIDTNVLVSGLLWRGPSHDLLEHTRTGRLSLVSSPELLAELAGVLARPKFRNALTRSDTDPERLLANVRAMAEIIEPPPLTAP